MRYDLSYNEGSQEPRRWLRPRNRGYRHNPDDTILRAFDTTPEDYRGFILQTRNPGPSATGSVFLEPQTWDSLRNADWEPYNHPAISAPAIGYRAPISGVFGLIRVDELGSDTELVLADPKGTGKVEVEAIGVRGDVVDFTVALVGPSRETGEPVLWTLFPGDPIMPSSISAEGVEGEIISVEEALELGFEWAKVVDQRRNPDDEFDSCACRYNPCECDERGESFRYRRNPDDRDIADEIRSILTNRRRRKIWTPLADVELRSLLSQKDVPLPMIRKIAAEMPGVFSTGTPRHKAYYVRDVTEDFHYHRNPDETNEFDSCACRRNPCECDGSGEGFRYRYHRNPDDEFDSCACRRNPCECLDSGGSFRRNPECTDTGEEIMPGKSQCVGCYLEGSEGPCPTWSHYLEKRSRRNPSRKRTHDNKRNPDGGSSPEELSEMFDSLRPGETILVAMRSVMGMGQATNGEYHPWKVGRRSISKKYGVTTITLLPMDGQKPNKFNRFALRKRGQRVSASHGDMGVMLIGIKRGTASRRNPGRGRGRNQPAGYPIHQTSSVLVTQEEVAHPYHGYAAATSHFRVSIRSRGGWYLLKSYYDKDKAMQAADYIQEKMGLWEFLTLLWSDFAGTDPSIVSEHYDVFIAQHPKWRDRAAAFTKAEVMRLYNQFYKSNGKVSRPFIKAEDLPE